MLLLRFIIIISLDNLLYQRMSHNIMAGKHTNPNIINAA